MQCMKCGVEVPEGQVFCDGCLEVMDKYPVKPGTPVNILPRKPAEKTQRKIVLSSRELYLRERRANRRLKILVLVLSLALTVLAVFMLLWTLFPGYDFIPGVTKPF